MFQNLARKATAAASPVRISGVARLRVSVIANFVPKAPLSNSQYASTTDSPVHRINTEQSSRAAATPVTGATVAANTETRSRGSNRMTRSF